MRYGQLKVYLSHLVSGRWLAALRARRQVEVGEGGALQESLGLHHSASSLAGGRGPFQGHRITQGHQPHQPNSIPPCV